MNPLLRGQSNTASFCRECHSNILGESPSSMCERRNAVAASRNVSGDGASTLWGGLLQPEDLRVE